MAVKILAMTIPLLLSLLAVSGCVSNPNASPALPDDPNNPLPWDLNHVRIAGNTLAVQPEFRGLPAVYNLQVAGYDQVFANDTQVRYVYKFTYLTRSSIGPWGNQYALHAALVTMMWNNSAGYNLIGVDSIYIDGNQVQIGE